MNRAVFLDRDGVLNELIYYPEQGVLDSPFVPGQFRLFPRVSEAIRKLQAAGYKAIVVSNQPGIAKGYLSPETFAQIRHKMKDELSRCGVSVDGEYYCHHHPHAVLPDLRLNCDCRKPQPGLLLQAARDFDIDPACSWMIGDGITDIQAGKKAGARTILIGRMKCELCSLMDEADAHPDAVAADLWQAAGIILK